MRGGGYVSVLKVFFSGCLLEEMGHGKGGAIEERWLVSIRVCHNKGLMGIRIEWRVEEESGFGEGSRD
jgi:hypothetical protein